MLFNHTSNVSMDVFRPWRGSLPAHCLSFLLVVVLSHTVCTAMVEEVASHTSSRVTFLLVFVGLVLEDASINV